MADELARYGDEDEERLTEQGLRVFGVLKRIEGFLATPKGQAWVEQIAHEEDKEVVDPPEIDKLEEELRAIAIGFTTEAKKGEFDPVLNPTSVLSSGGFAYIGRFLFDGDDKITLAHLATIHRLLNVLINFGRIEAESLERAERSVRYLLGRKN